MYLYSGLRKQILFEADMLDLENIFALDSKWLDVFVWDSVFVSIFCYFFH